MLLNLYASFFFVAYEKGNDSSDSIIKLTVAIIVNLLRILNYAYLKEFMQSLNISIMYDIFKTFLNDILFIEILIEWKWGLLKTNKNKNFT